MTPPPIPEHDFNRILREKGLYGKPKGSEYAAYRKSDDKLIAGYAVSHEQGKKREVKPVYLKNILKELSQLVEEETIAKQKVDAFEPVESKDSEDWKESEWYQEQKKREEDCPHEAKEET